MNQINKWPECLSEPICFKYINDNIPNVPVMYMKKTTGFSMNITIAKVSSPKENMVPNPDAIVPTVNRLVFQN